MKEVDYSRLPVKAILCLLFCFVMTGCAKKADMPSPHETAKEAAGEEHPGEEEMVAMWPEDEVPAAKNGDPAETSSRSDGEPRIYPVWYGTNRHPVNTEDLSKGFSTERGDRLYFGKCDVSIPKWHKFGSTGSGWVKRFFTGRDDRLKLEVINPLTREAYVQDINHYLQDLSTQDRTAVIFIHGFATTFDEAAIRAAQIGFDLKVKGVTAFYSWPSKGNVACYDPDKATVQASEKYIVEFLTLFSEQVQAEKIHLIAHSMGNYGLLRSLDRIARQMDEQSEKPFAEIILAAPDIDFDLFNDLSNAYSKLGEHTSLYVSSKDKALKSSGIVHLYPRVGYVGDDEYIAVFSGIDTIDVSDIDLTFLGHGYWAEAKSVLYDIHEVLKFGVAPTERLCLDSQQDNDGGVYWKIKSECR